jgi:hypothetical protein
MTDYAGQGPPWSNVFTRSRVAPVVFNVRSDHWRETTRLANEAGLPTVTSSSLYESSFRSTPLLNGLIIEVNTYGWAPPLPSGERVVGFKPFRLLCLLMNLHPPRRLKGEPLVPSAATLRWELENQSRLPEEELMARGRLGLRVGDRTNLLQLVRDLFGNTSVRTVNGARLEPPKG